MYTEQELWYIKQVCLEYEQDAFESDFEQKINKLFKDKDAAGKLHDTSPKRFESLQTKWVEREKAKCITLPGFYDDIWFYKDDIEKALNDYED